MIFLVLPCNCNSGWGICSTNLAREISKKTKIRYVSTEFNDQNLTTNAIELAYFKSCEFTNLDYLKKQVNFPLIQALQHDLTNYMDDFSGSFKVGLTFTDRANPSLMERSKKFDLIVAGSRWCKYILDQNNVQSQVILQGIDPSLFNKSRSQKQLFLDDFLIFSGGKFEHRKGQDVTIKAYKVLQDRYPDVKLVCAWHNPYTNDLGMKMLIESGVDLSRVISIGNLPNSLMPQIYQNTDVGIFPSRCEAGTNLVMMEYMACGKPAIATVGTGQADLINENTGLILEGTPCELIENNKVVSLWEDPNLDSAIENLDWAYNNQKKIKLLAKQGALFLSQYTWKNMAEKILSHIPNYLSSPINVQ